MGKKSKTSNGRVRRKRNGKRTTLCHKSDVSKLEPVEKIRARVEAFESFGNHLASLAQATLRGKIEPDIFWYTIGYALESFSETFSTDCDWTKEDVVGHALRELDIALGPEETPEV
jgi:hypothetical protein